MPNDKSLETLNKLYEHGLEENKIKKAQERLVKILNIAKSEAIVFGAFRHELVGDIFLAICKKKLIAVDFGISQETFIDHIESKFGQAPYYEPTKIKNIKAQVQDYLDGSRIDFDITFDLSSLTNFQRQVLMATLQIPRGKIVTYGDIARRIGNPKSVRAVGQALGRNPIPIVIPCHRVIASDGSLGGYSGGGGSETKARLLKLEGAQLFA
jgi:methylated-DNA-[protein]-cysteine S-methyltransferase